MSGSLIRVILMMYTAAAAAAGPHAKTMNYYVERLPFLRAPPGVGRRHPRGFSKSVLPGVIHINERGIHHSAGPREHGSLRSLSRQPLGGRVPTAALPRGRDHRSTGLGPISRGGHSGGSVSDVGDRRDQHAVRVRRHCRTESTVPESTSDRFFLFFPRFFFFLLFHIRHDLRVPAKHSCTDRTRRSADGTATVQSSLGAVVFTRFPIRAGTRCYLTV